MEFTYESYIDLINLLKNKNYSFCNYLNYNQYSKPVIFRHDIDMSLEKALKIAKLEYNENVSSTFFVLLSTNFYNIFSKESDKILKAITNLGHEIGLHFDEKRYEVSNGEELDYLVKRECSILGKCIEQEIKVVSMHRPSRWILENDIQFSGLINSYSKQFLSEFKYLSDSRMYWRENVLELIKSGSFNKLHILTHSFWYSEKNEVINDKLIDFLNNAKIERYDHMRNNIRDIEEIISGDELNNEY